jgi:hypothetical protein
MELNMTDKMYPRRSQSHLVEARSKRIFQLAIPPEWMPRELSENDYGIDFLLEFSGASNEIRGQVAAIQLKGTESGFSDSACRPVRINRTTFNMWLEYEAPVFLVLVDVASERVYFKSIEEECRRNYRAYRGTASLSVTFDFFPSDVYNPEAMLSAYKTAKLLRRMDDELPSIMSLYRDFVVLHTSRYRRDGHMPVDGDGSYDPRAPHGVHTHERKLRDLYERMRRISSVVDVDWSIPTVDEIVKRSAWTPEWGNEMYEAQFTATLDYLDDRMAAISIKLREIIGRCTDYWSIRRGELVAFASVPYCELSGLYWSDRERYYQLSKDL